MKRLDGYTFSSCLGLISIYIPKNVTSISIYSFTGCSNLNKINLEGTKDYISGAPWGAPKGMKIVTWGN